MVSPFAEEFSTITCSHCLAIPSPKRASPEEYTNRVFIQTAVFDDTLNERRIAAQPLQVLPDSWRPGGVIVLNWANEANGESQAFARSWGRPHRRRLPQANSGSHSFSYGWLR